MPTTEAVAGEIMWLANLSYGVFYAVKELSRSLTSPSQLDLTKAKRLLRYFKGIAFLGIRLRPVTQYSVGSSFHHWREMPSQIVTGRVAFALTKVLPEWWPNS